MISRGGRLLVLALAVVCFAALLLVAALAAPLVGSS